MKNWKKYQIKSRSINKNLDYVIFDLDDFVSYSGCVEKNIRCKNCLPFSNWKKWDYIWINEHETSTKTSIYIFTNTNNQVKFANCRCGYSIEETNALKKVNNDLEGKCNDLINELGEWKRKYEEAQHQLSHASKKKSIEKKIKI